MSESRNPFGSLPLDALGARDTALEPGQTLGRYTIEKEIAREGGRRDYTAIHNELGSRHVVRLVFVHSPSVRKRLVHEGRLQSRLTHPNVVQVTDAIEVQDGAALVFEEIVGETLLEHLERAPPDLLAALRLAAGIAQGLAYAHGEGLTHRDLRPENIWIVSGGDGVVPKLGGFGMAIEGDDPTAVAATTKTMGTPHYAAPEQFADARKVTHKADLWSLGVLIYEMVARVRPFEGDSFEVIASIRAGQRPPLQVPGVEVPRTLVSLVDQLLKVDPALRPGAATEVLASLAEIERLVAQPTMTMKRQNTLTQAKPVTTRRTSLATPRATPTLQNGTVVLTLVASLATLLALGLAIGSALG